MSEEPFEEYIQYDGTLHLNLDTRDVHDNLRTGTIHGISKGIDGIFFVIEWSHGQRECWKVKSKTLQFTGKLALPGQYICGMMSGEQPRRRIYGAQAAFTPTGGKSRLEKSREKTG